ncbi:MAG: hypothetical protein M3P27_13210 [Acidobacteriota bacterium]|nr:hypothetical protein [Acidobacteriota bacterium]
MSPSSKGRGWLDGDAYLFDTDGTLLNSRDGVHYHAFHNVIASVFGVASHIDGVPVHGNTDLGIVRAVLEREGVPAERFESGIPQLIEHMCEEVSHNAGWPSTIPTRAFHAALTCSPATDRPGG